MNKVVLFTSFAISILIITSSWYYQSTASGTFFTLVFAGFYVALCWWLKTLPDCEKLIKGYPRWSYLCALFHQALFLPVLSLALFYSIDSWDSWVDAPITPGTLTAVAHYTINGYMLKDFIVYDMNSCHLIHHLVTILGCSICLLIPAGGGYATANAITIEVGSALWNYQAVYPSWFAYTLYLMLFQLSNIMPIYYWAPKFLNLPELKDYQSIRVLSMVIHFFLVFLRTVAWILFIRDIVFSNRSENGEGKAVRGNVAMECGIREFAKKVD